MSNVTASELIARQAAAHPDVIAIFAEDSNVTYQQLIEQAAGISQFLAEVELMPEEPVAVLMHRSSNLIGTLLGVWNAGGAYMPIDPSEPSRRILQILEQSDCTQILGDSELWSTVLTQAAELAFDVSKWKFKDVGEIQPLSNSVLLETSTPVPTKPDASQLAYLLFTSGSNGVPKAVEVEHRSVANLLLRVRDILSVTSQDRYLAVATISFDISVVELFLPLIVGGSLVLSDKSILVDPHAMARLVLEKGVSIVQTGPSVWSVLLDEVPDFPHIRVAISTGEAVSPQIASKLVRYADQAWNFYGPTESTIWATAYQLSGNQQTGADWSGISAPIGHAIGGLNTLVVNPQNQIISSDEKGELLIGGIGVARGYHNRQALTQERFIHIEGKRFYRTGDLVSKDDSGVLQYFGRLDDQMKIRGMRVEPREVEEAIRLDSRVKDAATTWFDTPSGTKAIAAAIVLQNNTKCQSKDLHSELEDKLPLALIPSRFIFVPWLPIDRNGKVDRNAIRTAAMAQSSMPVVDAEPQYKLSSTTEVLVAGIWQRLLGVDVLSGDAHFFAMGGDSLAAVTMTLEVESEIGCNIPMQLVLEVPSLRDFAERIDSILNNNVEQSKSNFVFPLVERPGITPLFFCSADLSLAGNWQVPCPLYAIAFWTKDGAFLKMPTIEAMSSYFIEGIREKQPQGPYRLAGFSFGAIIALEIAQQLTEQGEIIECLFLLDPYKLQNIDLAAGTSNNDFPEIPKKPKKQWYKLHFGWGLRDYIQNINPLKQKHGFLGWIASILGPLDRNGAVQWFIYTLHHLLPRKHNPISEAYLARHHWHVFWFSARKKSASYRPKAYNGRAAILFSEAQSGQHEWCSILDEQTEIRFIKSEHLELFESPHVDDWMHWLTEELTTNSTVNTDIAS